MLLSDFDSEDSGQNHLKGFENKNRDLLSKLISGLFLHKSNFANGKYVKYLPDWRTRDSTLRRACVPAVRLLGDADTFPRSLKDYRRRGKSVTVSKNRH